MERFRCTSRADVNIVDRLVSDKDGSEQVCYRFLIFFSFESLVLGALCMFRHFIQRFLLP